VELNGVQTSPMVLPGEDRLLSMPKLRAAPLVAAIDLARIAIAPAVSSASERVVKLLDEPWSGLPRGLVEGANDGLSYLGIAVQSIAAEARLLAAPVSFELVSTAHAEGIEDRTTMGLLGGAEALRDGCPRRARGRDRAGRGGPGDRAPRGRR
jgi:histidine ammonia-lyase